MAGELDGMTAIITGGASGIGRAATHVFAREGAKLVIADIDEAGGMAAAKDIVDAGGDAIFVRCDVAEEADVEALVAAAVRQYGRLDCALNNAGAGENPKPLAEQSADAWDRMYRINQRSIFFCMKHETPMMLERGGAIVNISSNSALVGLGGLTPYSSSKGGVIAASQSAAVEFAPQGIRINTICPGLVGVKGSRDRDWAKELGIPAGRAGEFSEVGEVAAFLCSPRASYVAGQVISVDGGQTAS